MAESVFNHLAQTTAPGLAVAQSAGTASYHVGEWPDYRTLAVLKDKGIHQYSRARQLTVDDFYTFGYVIAMDRQNLEDLQTIRPKNASSALRLFGEFGHQAIPYSEVPDPYYGQLSDFEHVYNLVLGFSKGLLRHIAGHGL
ncbi:MAG: low molecular weight phosphotyrosine protein phosphatase [Bacteroidetes bacterium]|jgi:protein-tyrosine-phosphatase|nr:low molecular weight phosphotyrosine protein phosphatase [Bacteroidota bacterium]